MQENLPHRIASLITGRIRNLTIFSIGLAIFYFLLFGTQCEFSETVWVNGDSWSYQSIAVNFATGHGYHRVGALEDLETYKFADNAREQYLNHFKAFTGMFAFHRTPGYPTFLSVCYATFGVDPAIAKRIQLFLLALVAAGLPIIGLGAWGRMGFISGIVAGPVFLVGSYQLSQEIMSEALAIFTLFLVVGSGVYYAKRESRGSAILMGLCMGVSVLVKGNLILIPFIFLVYLGWKFLQTRNRRMLGHVLAAVISFLTVLLPWSYTATSQANKLKLDEIKAVVLAADLTYDQKVIKVNTISPDYGVGFIPEVFSEKNRAYLEDEILPNVRKYGIQYYQKKYGYEGVALSQADMRICQLEQLIQEKSLIILRTIFARSVSFDAHNEYVGDGTRHGEWRHDPESFYNNDGMESSHFSLRIFNFYLNNITYLPKLVFRKVDAGFGGSPFLWLLLILGILSQWLSVISGKWNNPRIRAGYGGLIVLLAILPLVFDLGDVIWLNITWLLLYLLVSSYWIKSIVEVPFVFYAVFFNFLLFTAIVIGLERWTQVMDFLFILTAVHCILTMARKSLIALNVMKAQSGVG